ncbi:unnamed protein product [Caenorhabditis brenneri]
MNNFPSLYELSLDAVAGCFENGILPTHHVEISPKVREEIFETVMRIRDYCYDQHTKELIKMFQPTKLHLKFQMMKEGKFDELKKLKLVKLRIQGFEWISKFKEPKPGQSESTAPVIYTFRVGLFLDEILSRETKEGLRVLDLSNHSVSFSQNRMEELSSMFPNLEDLNICCRKMCVTDFESLCSNLPHLRTLNISATGIKNLNGLAKLQNLECLSIYGLLFETKEDIKDLFELKKLKKLIFGYCSSDWNYDWFFEKPHRELETLVCLWHPADNAFLRRIVPKLPRLQTVVAYETGITQEAASPEVSLCTGESVEAMMKTIGYLRSQSDLRAVLNAFDYFVIVWSEWTEIDVEIPPEQTILMVNELEAVIRVFKLGNQCLPYLVGQFIGILEKCLYVDRNHLNIYKLKVLNILSKNLRHHLKKRTHPSDNVFINQFVGIENLIKTTENFNVDKICSLAMKSIIYGRGLYDGGNSCAVIMEILMDRMDISLEYYRNINFRKLHACLRTIQNKADLWPPRRASAGNVLRFVELFM